MAKDNKVKYRVVGGKHHVTDPNTRQLVAYHPGDEIMLDPATVSPYIADRLVRVEHESEEVAAPVDPPQEETPPVEETPPSEESPQEDAPPVEGEEGSEEPPEEKPKTRGRKKKEG